MAYTTVNYKSKKALKEAIAAGHKVTAFQPGPFGPDLQDGRIFLEGPHYPEPHRWYAQATLENGLVTSVK